MILKRVAFLYISKLIIAFTAGISLFSLFTIVCYHYFSTPDNGQYLAISSIQGVLDYDIFEKNIENVIEPLSRADVIILGTSRTQFGFDRDVLCQFFKEYGLRYFILGFANGRSTFPIYLFDKYNISPRLIVATGDDKFFGNPASSYENDSEKRTYFVSLLRNLYARALLSLDIATKYIGYNLGIGKTILQREKRLYLFRSRNDGAYTSYAYSHDKWIANPPRNFAKGIYIGNTECKVSPHMLEGAIKFKERLCKRGSLLVITSVPYPGFCTERAKAISQFLRVPYLEISSKHLFTFDNSHLDKASSRLFTIRFLKKLKRSDIFKSLLIK